MELEVIIAVLAIFVSGGAMGAAGTLLGQWVLKKISAPPPRHVSSVDPRELKLLKGEVADMAVRLHSVDARLDFTEQLLGGALLGSAAPEPLPPPEAGQSSRQGESAGPREHSAPGAAAEPSGPPEPNDPPAPDEAAEPNDPAEPSDTSAPSDTSGSLEVGG